MANYNQRATLTGALAGLSISAAAIAVAWINAARNPFLQAVTNFIAAPSVLFSWAVGIPETLAYILFLIYGALVGGILGRLISRRTLPSRLAALLFAIFLLAAHSAAQSKLARDIEEVLRAVVKALLGW
jgi:hypothetical protein